MTAQVINGAKAKMEKAINPLIGTVILKVAIVGIRIHSIAIFVTDTWKG